MTDIIDGGVCGTFDMMTGNIWTTWLFRSTGLFEIGGRGKMQDLNFSRDQPWSKFRKKIQAVKVNDGSKNIAQRAFQNCENLTTVRLPQSVTIIGAYAFIYCKSLTEITLFDRITNIGEKAFTKCVNLKDVYYTGSEEQWKEIEIADGNDELKNATIHFNSIVEEKKDKE